jgi:acetyl-CoA carboxylase biotin carboxyl carrier protein
MELKEIQTLIKFVANQGVDEVSIEQKDFKLSIKKNEKQEVVPQMVQAIAQPSIPAQQVVQAPANPTTETAAPASTESNTDSNLIEIKSPMIGTFYRAANPESPDFVNVGDDVNPDSVVCIIEAMKLFNEIESEVKGKIVKVLVDNASPVEYDQPLFLVDPS